MLAQLRGQYGPAEEHYRQSLAIAERLGDQAGLALSEGQLGTLYTEQGRPAEAVPRTVAALAFFLPAGAPEANSCICWLPAQRTAPGDERFAELLPEHLDADSVRTVLSLTTPRADEQLADTNQTVRPPPANRVATRRPPAYAEHHQRRCTGRRTGAAGSRPGVPGTPPCGELSGRQGGRHAS